MLLHTARLSDELIETIAAIPVEMNWTALDAVISDVRIDKPESLAMLLWTVDRLRSLDQHQGVKVVLSDRQPIWRCCDI